jgi:hypothetical protein
MNFIQSETKLVKSFLPFQCLASRICPAMSIMNLFADTPSSRKKYVSFFLPRRLSSYPSAQQPPPDAAMITPGSAYDDFPSPEFPTAARDHDKDARLSKDRDPSPRRSLQLCSTFLGSDPFTGDHLRDRSLRWLSPSDPSTNHNITRNVHHNGTAQWFFQNSIYNQWKSSGSFLWVRGKRALLLVFSMQRPPTISYFYSWFREKCALVCPSSTHSVLAELTSSIQFLNHRRYRSPARFWAGLDGLLLF